MYRSFNSIAAISVVFTEVVFVTSTIVVFTTATFAGNIGIGAGVGAGTKYHDSLAATGACLHGTLGVSEGGDPLAEVGREETGRRFRPLRIWLRLGENRQLDRGHAAF